VTLNTSIYVLSQADPHETFWKCRELLNAPESLPFVDEESPYDKGRWDLRNPGGVGLDAWLWMHYRPGAMLRERAESHDEWCGDDCDGRHHDPPHWFEVTFDTAYGYKDDQGRGCGALHASLVAQLGEWFDGQGIQWAWQNEFTGEIHIGDRYERLFDLFGEGDQARQWFEEIVKPVIFRLAGGVGPR
jgi:hypothetical protein